MAASAPSNPGGSLLPKMSTTDMMMPFLLVGILGLLIVPLPTLALDMLLTLNITISLLILLTALQIERPLDISVFPPYCSSRRSFDSVSTSLRRVSFSSTVGTEQTPLAISSRHSAISWSAAVTSSVSSCS